MNTWRITRLTLLALVVAGTLAAAAAAGRSPAPVVTPAEPAFPTMPSYVPAPLDVLPSGRTAQNYRTIADYNAELQALIDANPGLARLIELPYRTMEGRPVYGIEITNSVEDDSDGKPVFFMMGAIHGNEWPAAEHSLEFAYDLLNLASSDPAVASLLDRVRATIVPVVNVGRLRAQPTAELPALHRRRVAAVLAGANLRHRDERAAACRPQPQLPVRLGRPRRNHDEPGTRTGLRAGEPERHRLRDDAPGHGAPRRTTPRPRRSCGPRSSSAPGDTPDEDIYVPLAPASWRSRTASGALQSAATSRRRARRSTPDVLRRPARSRFHVRDRDGGSAPGSNQRPRRRLPRNRPVRRPAESQRVLPRARARCQPRGPLGDRGQGAEERGRTDHEGVQPVVRAALARGAGVRPAAGGSDEPRLLHRASDEREASSGTSTRPSPGSGLTGPLGVNAVGGFLLRRAGRSPAPGRTAPCSRRSPSPSTPASAPRSS